MKTLVNNIKTVALLGVLTAFLLFAGNLIGGQGGVIIALVLAVVMNAVSLLFGDRIALMSMQAREVGPDHPLHQMVARLAERAQMPMPKVYVSPQMAPNAFATGRGPKSGKVCATEGLLQLLNPNEIAGVMAHELAHIKHRDILTATIAATISGAIGYLGYIFMFGGDEENPSPLGAIGGLLLLILSPIAAAIIQMAISRQREYAADTEGGNIVGEPMYLATALEKVHAYATQIPLQAPPQMNAMMIAEGRGVGGAIAGLFRTHPKLEDRLENLIGAPSTGTVRTGR